MGGGVLLRHLAAAVAIALALAGCARPAARTPQLATAPSVAPSRSPIAAVYHGTPKPSPRPAHSATPAPSPQPTIAPATPRPKSTVVMVAPDAPPKIFSVKIEPPVLHSGETVHGTVVTPSNVASVELRFAGYSTTMIKTSPGHFAFSYQLPNVPFFLKNTYTVTVIARNTRGDKAEKIVPITIE
jgi:hypothetical protein